MRKAAARIRIRQICGLGLGEELLATALIPAVRELVASESSAFAWVDSQGRVTNVYADRLSSMCLLTSLSDPCMQAHASHPSIHHFEAASESGLNRILRAIVHDSGRELAQISLCRPASASGFSRDEVSELSGVLHYITHGMVRGRVLGRGQMNDLEFGDGPEEALVITDRLGTLMHATEEGRRMLLLAAGCKIDSTTLSSAPIIVSDFLRAICGAIDAPVSSTRMTTWGRFVLRVYPLRDCVTSHQSLVGVYIRRQEPVILEVVRAISQLPLSPQQRQIALQIAQGQSNREISASLHLSCNTVAYHVRQLFRKLGVHDRAGLMMRIRASSEDSMGPIAEPLAPRSFTEAASASTRKLPRLVDTPRPDFSGCEAKLRA